MRIAFSSFDEVLPLKDLRRSKHQRNVHPHEQIERLALIMREHGVRQPISISRQSGEVCFGHGRWEAALHNKWTEFPVVYQDFDSPEEEYACVQSDNAIAHWAELDLVSIHSDLLEFPDLDPLLLGIENFEVIETEQLPGADEDEVPEHVEPNAKLGDIYQLGRHRLMCGDSTQVDTVTQLMNSKLAKLVFSDPPYGVNYEGGALTKRRKLENDHDNDIYTDVLPMFHLATEEKAPLYIWHAAGYADMASKLGEAGFKIRAQLIWNKNQAQFGALSAQYKQKHEPCFYCHKENSSPYWYGPTNEVTVWDVSRESKNEFHPTQKPVELVERALLNSSQANDAVLDLFGGSGSTLIACEKTKRTCFMMELDPHYIDVIIARWEKYSGGKAELLSRESDTGG